MINIDKIEEELRKLDWKNIDISIHFINLIENKTDEVSPAIHLNMRGRGYFSRFGANYRIVPENDKIMVYKLVDDRAFRPICEWDTLDDFLCFTNGTIEMMRYGDQNAKDFEISLTRLDKTGGYPHSFEKTIRIIGDDQENKNYLTEFKQTGTLEELSEWTDRFFGFKEWDEDELELKVLTNIIKESFECKKDVAK